MSVQEFPTPHVGGITDGGDRTTAVPNIIEKILCNQCGNWARGPYRRGRCPRCTGVIVGGLRVCCGDCDQYPCVCQSADDADMCAPWAPWVA